MGNIWAASAVSLSLSKIRADKLEELIGGSTDELNPHENGLLLM